MENLISEKKIPRRLSFSLLTNGVHTRGWHLALSRDTNVMSDAVGSAGQRNVCTMSMTMHVDIYVVPENSVTCKRQLHWTAWMHAGTTACTTTKRCVNHWTKGQERRPTLLYTSPPHVRARVCDMHHVSASGWIF